MVDDGFEQGVFFGGVVGGGIGFQYVFDEGGEFGQDLFHRLFLGAELLKGILAGFDSSAEIALTLKVYVYSVYALLQQIAQTGQLFVQCGDLLFLCRAESVVVFGLLLLLLRKAGYVCDTHCIRITGLLGLTDGSKDPLKVEQQLRACIPPEESSNFCHRMVLHGRAVCVARRPDCAGCTLRDLCDYGKTVREP